MLSSTDWHGAGKLMIRKWDVSTNLKQDMRSFIFLQLIVINMTCFSSGKKLVWTN